MKQDICAIVLAGVVCVMGCHQTSSFDNAAQAEVAILKTHNALIAAAEKRDAKTMFSYVLENDKAAIAQNGQLLSRQEAMEQTQQGFERVTDIKYTFKQRNITMLSPTTGLLTATGITTSTVETGRTFTSTFANTTVFVFRDDGWKIIHGHHSIPIPQ